MKMARNQEAGLDTARDTAVNFLLALDVSSTANRAPQTVTDFNSSDVGQIRFACLSVESRFPKES